MACRSDVLLFVNYRRLFTLFIMSCFFNVEYCTDRNLYVYLFMRSYNTLKRTLSCYIWLVDAADICNKLSLFLAGKNQTGIQTSRLQMICQDGQQIKHRLLLITSVWRLKFFAWLIRFFGVHK